MGVITDEKNPTKGSLRKLSPKPDLEGKFLTEEEVEAIKKQAYPNARNYALVAILAATGVRMSEAVNLNRNDIHVLDTPKGQKYFGEFTRKGGAKQHIYLPDGTVRAIQRMIGDGEPLLDPENGTPLFTSKWGQEARVTPVGARKTLEKLAKNAGIKKPFTPHWFRHTFVSQLVKQGLSLRDIQYVAGHASITTTERYMRAMNAMIGDHFPVQF